MLLYMRRPLIDVHLLPSTPGGFSERPYIHKAAAPDMYRNGLIRVNGYVDQVR